MINKTQLEKWFSNYKGMCMEIFGWDKENNQIAFPSYGCQAEKIYNEMRKLLTK